MYRFIVFWLGFAITLSAFGLPSKRNLGCEDVLSSGMPPGIFDHLYSRPGPSQDLLLERVRQVIQLQDPQLLANGLELYRKSQSSNKARVLVKPSLRPNMSLVTIAPVLMHLDGEPLLKIEEGHSLVSIGNALIHSGFNDDSSGSRIYFFTEKGSLETSLPFSAYVLNLTPEDHISFKRRMSPLELRAWSDHDIETLRMHMNFRGIIYTEFRHEVFAPLGNVVRFRIPKPILKDWAAKGLVSLGIVGLTDRNPDGMVIEAIFDSAIWEELFPYISYTSTPQKGGETPL